MWSRNERAYSFLLITSGVRIIRGNAALREFQLVYLLRNGRSIQQPFKMHEASPRNRLMRMRNGDRSTDVNGGNVLEEKYLVQYFLHSLRPLERRTKLERNYWLVSFSLSLSYVTIKPGINIVARNSLNWFTWDTFLLFRG